MRPALMALYHNQPVTPLKTDNLTTEGFVKSGIKPNFSKTWDIKWHWLTDKEVIEKLIVYWHRGTNNNPNYLKNITLQFTTIKYDLGIYIP